jgi:hypothetical protein
MMPEVEEAPSVSLCKPLAVFHRYIDAVVLTVEATSARWFRARAVRKVGLRTRVNSFTMTVPRCRHDDIQGKLALLLFKALGVSGAPTKTHVQKVAGLGNFNLPIESNTAAAS